jgi:hypothetical protein
MPPPRDGLSCMNCSAMALGEAYLSRIFGEKTEGIGLLVARGSVAVDGYSSSDKGTRISGSLVESRPSLTSRTPSAVYTNARRVPG